MSKLKAIAILMTCYNRAETTLECLRRLFSQDAPVGYSFDVWLVDDASPDKTGEKVKNDYPQVNVIQGVGNLFWSKGMHLAWQMAVRYAVSSSRRYDFFLWLNDDVQLKPGALTNILSDHERIGGVVVGKFSSDASEGDISYGLKDGRFMNGNFVLIPREVVDKVGIICDKYHHQYGDYDYGLHVLKAGFTLSSSTHICGVCPQQPERYKHLAGKNLLQRFKLLWDPRGYDLHDAVLYKYRNFGLLKSMLTTGHVIWNVLRG